jgi:hypothetical protein
MKKYILCFVSAGLALLLFACGSAVTFVFVNQSANAIFVDDEAKSYVCPANQMVSFIPRRTNYDVVIRVGREAFNYNLAPMPESFLDRRNNKRVLFAFSEDRKLYLLKPTDDPLHEPIQQQPQGYPLIPIPQRTHP